MEYTRIQSINDPLFKQMHDMMSRIFPPEEVLAFDLWAEPLEDEGIRIFVAVKDGQVVGATEYRYYEHLRVAMTDFTIIGEDGQGIGSFLARKRQEDLQELVKLLGKELIGMFAEIYNPYLVDDYSFGGVKSMNPYVRREVLSHMGYRRLNVEYVHPSWNNDGEAVQGLDLCFLPYNRQFERFIPSQMVVKFLTGYYAVLPNKPQSWHEMINKIEQQDQIELLPI
ncbi:GNAT family N-acetyltransferase [Brevibacillus sp. SYSU BS000544]|uniref:GNAT family N-acetyltransferase n=1 Tax=Brevibacillus sp. SYSU BS000544 TaxID=3416443 RepID=UPI003CE4AC66